MKRDKIGKALIFVCEVAFVAMLAAAVHAAPGEMPAEIGAIKNGTENYIKGICWLIGSGSTVVGTWKFVQTQSLQAAALGGTVTILAFKLPAWVVAAAVI